MTYMEIKDILKRYLMETYDIRPSLAEKTVEVMFYKGADYISTMNMKEESDGLY